MDLTSELRQLADALEGDEWSRPLCADELCRDAADEIERLRKAMKLFIGRRDGIPWYDVPDSDIDDWAAAAAGGEA